MILLTMGTYPAPFDRMVKAVDELWHEGLIGEEVFAQIGYSDYVPKYLKYERLMEKEAFDICLASASALIGHAGMGTITLALEHGKPLLVMPRMRKYHEHVNDHQVGTAHKFEELGHVLAAYEVKELPGKIAQLRSFSAKHREHQADRVALRLRRFLEELASGS